MFNEETIEREELRQGNWLLDRTDRNYCIVQAVDELILLEKFGSSSYRQNLYHLRAIPLNADILSLALFKATTEAYQRKLSDSRIISVRKHSAEVFRLDDNNGHKKFVMYVHQFQNAFFDLCGQRLDINLFGI